jgi:inosine-uridine nucleoside N-ribohydrolase
LSWPVHRRHNGSDGAPVDDALAVAHVIDSTLVETRHCGLIVDSGPEPSLGHTHVDLWGVDG